MSTIQCETRIFNNSRGGFRHWPATDHFNADNCLTQYLNIDHVTYYSLEDYMKYKPEEEEELDAKTKQYIRMGELLREKTTDLTQLIVM